MRQSLVFLTKRSILETVEEKGFRGYITIKENHTDYFRWERVLFIKNSKEISLHFISISRSRNEASVLVS